MGILEEGSLLEESTSSVAGSVSFVLLSVVVTVILGLRIFEAS